MVVRKLKHAGFRALDRGYRLLSPTLDGRKLPSASNDRRIREEFLRSSHAHPTDLEAYALWLSVFERDYNTRVPMKERAYADADPHNIPWTPTQAVEAGVPALYGYYSLSLFLIMPYVYKERPKPATTGPDSTYHWGDTRIRTLHVGERHGQQLISVWTNFPSEVGTYPDVEEYRSGKTIDQLFAQLQKVA